MIIKGGSPLELVDLAPFPDLVDMPEKENENSETLFCFGESCRKEPGMLGRCTYSLSGQTQSLNLMQWSSSIERKYLPTPWTDTMFNFDFHFFYMKI